VSVDNLRWILLLVGMAIVAAIYFSNRFGLENWTRERGGGRRAETARDAEELLVPGITPDSPAPADDWDEAVAEARAPLATAEVEDLSIAAESPRDEVAAAEPSDTIAVTAAEDEVETLDKEAGAEAGIGPEQLSQVGLEPLVLVLTVLAQEGATFQGQKIKSVLEAEGFTYGDMRIYHYSRNAHQDALFSIANLVEPGHFDLFEIAQLTTPGLAMFCQLPGAMVGNDAFDLMLGKAQIIAQRLGGQVCDDKRNLLTPQAIAHYRDRINMFDVDLALAGKKLSQG
jgi:cell division protein ZipA